MGRVKLIFGLGVLALALNAGWQIGSCELINLEFQQDLRDIAAQTGSRIGLYSFSTDQELRAAVIRTAKTYDLQMEGEQVTVQSAGTGAKVVTYLAVDYKARVKLAGYQFNLHFKPSSAR
jgi:hypothetical protein